MEKYKDVSKVEIENHNNIEEMRKKSNKEFMDMKGSDLDQLDQAIEELEAKATEELEGTPWMLNDRYLRDDVVQKGEDGESNED